VEKPIFSDILKLCVQKTTQLKGNISLVLLSFIDNLEKILFFLRIFLWLEMIA